VENNFTYAEFSAEFLGKNDFSTLLSLKITIFPNIFFRGIFPGIFRDKKCSKNWPQVTSPVKNCAPKSGLPDGLFSNQNSQFG
jgi:hypothetical protein